MFRVVLLFALISVSACFKIQPRIMNGLDSNRGQFPYYAYILTTEGSGDDKEYFSCGGTILNEHYVLTAAHCLFNASVVLVLLGSLEKDQDEEGTQMIGTGQKSFILHPHFEHDDLLHDIALIKLPRPAVYSNIIQPVTFPDVCEVSEGTELVVMGNGKWNETDEDNEYPHILQYTTLRTLPHPVCSIYFELDEETTFCARGYSNESICQGDSGGPIVHPTSHALYGISSFTGSNCNGTPQGFVNVFPYIPWISEMTGIQFTHCN